MTDKSIQSAIQNLLTIAKAEARAELLAELGGAKPVRAQRQQRAVPKKRQAKRAAKVEAKETRAPRTRTTPEELQSQADSLLEFITANPGKNSEEIGAALQLDTATFRRPLKTLIAAGKIMMTGKARGARYSVPAPEGTVANGAAKKPRASRRVVTTEA